MSNFDVNEMVSLDLNFKLYQQIIDIFNIPQDDYAPDYIFDLKYEEVTVMQPVGSTYYYPVVATTATNGNTTLNEKALMQLIFSKFISDKIVYDDKVKTNYTKYILKEFFAFTVSNELLTIYYKDHFSKIINVKPYMDPDIIDFDISDEYASYDVKYYLFYLDIISQIYRYAHDKKAKKEIFPELNIPMKSRYYLYADSIKYSDPFDINLQLVIQGYNNDIVDITCSSPSDRPVYKAFVLFKTDILNHFAHLQGEDVKLTGLAYLKTIEYFYKFCRLRLMYLIAHCIKLNGATIDDYILDEILAVFTNFRQMLNTEILQNDDFKMTKNMLYNKSVFDTSSKLSDINKQLQQNRDNILNHQSMLEYIDKEYTGIYQTHLMATGLLFIVIFTTIVLYSIKLNVNTKAFISLSMTVILVAVIIILYAESGYKKPVKNIIENFDEDVVRYPRERLTGYQTTYKNDGTIVKIKTSLASQSICAIDIFNKNRTSSCTTTYESWFTNNSYDWIVADIGEYIVLKSFHLQSTKSGFPSSFTLYGSKYIADYNNYNNQNQSTSNWVSLYSINMNLVNDITDQQPSITETVINQEQYRFFLFDLKDSPSTRRIVKHLYFNGIKNNSSVTIISNEIASVNTTSYASFDPLNLPDDYSDNNLIGWDLKIVAQETSSECVNLSIGTFCFNSSRTIEVTDETYSLDPFDTQYVTGGIAPRNTSLSKIKFELTIRYYPNATSTEQSDVMTKFSRFEQDKSAANAARDSALISLNNTCNILQSSNQNISNLNIQLQLERVNSNITYRKLAASAIYSNIQLIVDTSNATLNSLLQSSNNLQIQISQLQVNLATAIGNYSISSNAYNTLLASYSNLAKDSVMSLHSLQRFISTSEEQLYADIETKIYQRDLEGLKNNMLTLQQVTSNQLTLYASNILASDLQLALAQSQQRSERARYATSASFLRSQADAMDVANTKLQTAYDGVDALHTQFVEQYTAEIVNRDTTSNAWITALDARKGKEAEALLTLNTYNQSKNTNYASLDDLNEALNNQLKQSASDSAMYDREVNDIDKQSKIQQLKLSNAYAVQAFYTALSSQTENTISQYDGIIQEYESKIQQFKTLKETRQGNLDLAQDESANRIRAALQQYNNIDETTMLDILDLKEQHSALLVNIVSERKREEERYKLQLEYMQKRQTAEKVYDDLIKQKDAEIASCNYYKSVRDAIKDDVNVSMLIKDIDVIILYSVSDCINGINYELITPNMAKEYYKYDNYNKSIKLAAYQSEFDLNNKILNIRSMEAKTVLFLNLALIIMVCGTIHYYLSSELAAAIALIAIIIVIIIYSVKIKGPVRNRANNYYWR